MKKWGRRKAAASASKHSFCPISWLSKLKRKDGDTERKPAKGKGKGERNSDSPRFSWAESWNDGRFCGGDDDRFWRISFGEDRFEGEKSRVGLRSVWYCSDDELEVPVFGNKNCKLKETPKFNEMVSDIRKMRELNRKVDNSAEIGTFKGEEGKKFKVPRRKAAKGQKSKRRDLKGKRREMERESDRAEEKLMVAEEKDIFELEPTAKIQTTEGNLLRTIEEDCVFEALNLEKNDGFSKEGMKIKEVMSKIEKKRKSVYITRELQRRKQSGKVRVSTSRTATKIECKIKALEDMKRAKLKKKKKKKKKKKNVREVEERTTFDNFAMVKCSYNPEQDFRDSMVEMIREKRIRRPEELEEFLACYLTLNSDEYHDLIIKVFRQVWFDLDEACFGPEL